MDFVGGNVIFRFSVISPNRGAVFGQTVAKTTGKYFSMQMMVSFRFLATKYCL
jgi:hypothetical protein